jgi:hypothetical protein
MKTSFSSKLLLWAAALALASFACGRTVAYPHPQKCVFDADCDAGLRCVDQLCQDLVILDAGPFLKRFGEPCDAGAECDSRSCVNGPRGAFCTRGCDAADAGCPDSYACAKVPQVFPDTDGATALVALCTVAQPFFCQPCSSTDAGARCGASGADLCFTAPGGAFCARDCEFTACPEGSECVDGLDPLGPHKQCVPKGRTCNCTAENVGLAVTCSSSSDAGHCPGRQRCQADAGFSACDAPPALPETCNGVDDNCDGLVDNGVWDTCTRTAHGVTCTGPQRCLASAGLVCAAQLPATEVCNFEDDDCDGVIDNGFVDGQGRYTQPANCGVCNNDCSKAIAHATSTRCDVPDGGSPACQATACEAGYFPYADGGLCLELPDTLCRACAVDADCVGPGSRCLAIDGARVCGRDCSAGSAYPACPSGYACQALDAGASQCVPVTGTCTCRSTTLGATRSCTVSVCKGFEACGSTAQGPAWGACDVNSFNPEICDGKDNNCNGQIDEGFVNAATGRYDTAQNCGFCNNDCTKYFSPSIQHTTGVCDTTPAMPACKMGACLTESSGGVTYEWVDVDGQPADGCECRRVQGNLTGDLPDRAPATGSGASWVDENCDGIDGVVGDAIFVSTTAAAGGNGSRTAPFVTIAQGLAAMQAQGKRYVLVAQGLYRENVKLFDGAQLFGGYSSDFLKRDPKVHTTTIEGQAPASGFEAAVHAENVGTAETVVAGFTLQGWDVSTAAAPGAEGLPSVALLVRNAGARLVVRTCDILAGRGGQGGDGPTGVQGFGRQASAALNGAIGLDSTFFGSGSCQTGTTRAGGLGGVNGTCAAATATAGGAVVCPVYAFGTHQGQEQQYEAPPLGSRNGRGGWDWSYDTLSGNQCGHVTESGWPSAIQSHDGADGLQGADGTGGQGGAGAPAAARFGSVLNGRWVAAAARAGAGAGGATAEGGGGGGAGGGVASFPMGGCQGWEIGATGGGGGAGGCGGAGGTAGGAGGASIAVLLAYTVQPLTLPDLRGNRIQRAIGGTGGNGGFGGPGGLGGAGGFGGQPQRWSSSMGGKGGEGGNGGPGGGGGGGAGGPSFGILAFNTGVTALVANNTFLTSASTNTGGAGGAGGSSPGSTTTGTAGVAGTSADAQALVSCGGGCASGTSCDANGVCIPN